MGVTSKLLALYRVDQQLHGLKGRLRSAEAYLKEQDRLLGEIDTNREALESQVRQLEASVHNTETEASALDERIATIRDRMNNASTSKEHSALLTEMNTLKADKELIEEGALGSLEELEQLRTKLTEIESERVEREKVRGVAEGDREKRAADIKDRVAELEGQRKEALADVPASALAAYDELVQSGRDEVMAPVEEQDRRNREYSCGGCYTHLPVELLNTLLNRGDLVRCPSCSVILYLEEDLRESINTAAEKKRKRREVNAG
jgi:predicted  nucleic acid-binding Zn-ribbon protein